MPGFKRSRNYRRRRPMYKKRRTNGVFKAIKRLRRSVDGEVKKVDTSVTSLATIGFGGDVWYITPIAQGDGVNTREGLSVKLKYLSLKGFVQRNPSATSGDLEHCAVDVVLDSRQVQGANPSVTDIFETASPLSQLAVDNVGRFKILFHRMYSIDDLVYPQQKFEVFKRIFKRLRFYSSTTGSISQNGIYLVMRTTSTANGPQTIWNARVGYVDN